MSVINEGSFRILESKDMDSTDNRVDFHSNYIRFKNWKDVPIIGFVEVTEDLSQRLDLIVSSYYGNAELLDVFLKFNGIGDMFAVPIGTRLLVPDMFSLLSSIEFCSTEPKLALHSTSNNKFGRSNTGATNTSSRKTKETRGTGWKVVKNGVIKF